MAYDPEYARRALGSIHLALPDKSWPKYFARERDRLRPYLDHVAKDLQHFGSTAVPGLRAKPVIDMMAPVSLLNQADALGNALMDAGYRKIDAGFIKRRFFRREPEGKNPAYHLHLVVSPTWPTKNELLLRDWIIQHPETARAYEALKIELAERYAESMPLYTDGKTSFLRRVTDEARLNQGLPAESDWEE